MGKQRTDGASYDIAGGWPGLSPSACSEGGLPLSLPLLEGQGGEFANDRCDC